MAEEAAFVAQEFVSSLDNLPAEIAHILSEIKTKEERCQDLTNRLQARTSSLLKHVRTQPLTTPNPKEAPTLPKIAAEFDKIAVLSSEKVALASRLVDLMGKHRGRLELDVLGRVADLGGVPVPPTPVIPGVGGVPGGPGSNVGGGGTKAGQKILEGLSGTGESATKKRRTSSLNPASTAAAYPSGTPTYAPPYPSSLSNSQTYPPNQQTPSQSAPYSAQSSYPSQQPYAQSSSSSSNRHPSQQPQQQYASSSSQSAQRNNHRHPSPSTSSTTSTSNSRKRSRASATTNNNAAPSPPPQAAQAMVDEGGEDDGGDDDTLYCYCRQRSSGEMVGCDNESCEIEWFHVKCVQVPHPLPDSWFCPSCVSIKKGRKGRK